MKHPVIIDSRGNIGSKSFGGIFNKIISKYISSVGGRQQLARAMLQPLRTVRDYNSIARKSFLVEPLSIGALPFYDHDINVCKTITSNYSHNEVIINSRNKIQNRRNFITPSRVTVPFFNIASNPIIKLSDIKIPHFNLIDRISKK